MELVCSEWATCPEQPKKRRANDNGFYENRKLKNDYFMKQKCVFVSGRDIVQTVPGLQVNISDSIDFHRIQDTSVPSQYNGQQSLSDVGVRIREPFDVIEYDRSYTRVRAKVLKDKADKESKGDK